MTIASGQFGAVRALWQTWVRPVVVRQFDASDCGPACLLTVLRTYGGNKSLGAIRTLARTNASGTTLYDLARAAGDLGFDAVGVEAGYTDLVSCRTPCIASVTTDSGSGHYVVVRKAGKRFVMLSDPARGARLWKRHEFEKAWKERVLLLLEPTERIVREPRLSEWSFLLGHLKGSGVLLSQAVFTGIVFTGLGLATAYGIQHLIDDVLPARNLNGAVATIAALLVVQSVRAVLGVLRARYLLEANARVGTGIVDEFLQNLFAQPAEFYLGRGNGEYTSRLQDSVRVQGLVARAFGNTIVDCTIVGGAVLYLALLAPVWSIALLSALCMLAVVFGVASKHLEDRQRAMLQAYTETEARLLDASEGAVDVAAYGAGSTVCVATQQAHSEFQSCAQVLGGTVAEINMTADATGSTILLGSLCFGALAVMNGTMRLGAMMAAYSLVAQAIPAVLRIVDGASTLQAASLGLSRLLEYQATSSGAPGVSPAGGGASQDAGASIVSVCLDVVTFEWPGGQPLLERVSACFEAGRISSIHGRSGSGKSTLASIIAQQLRPTDGRVSYRDRRGQAGLAVAPTLSVVREHVKIFECSVFDNIGLGRSDVDHTAVSRAVEILRVDKFVSSLTGGLQTIVGKRGRSLSAGERQIIGLLRAFARIPEVLVLDECLNALDAEHRSEIVKGLQAFATEHVVVLISHHLQELHLHATGWLLEGGSLMRTAPGIELATERL